MWGWVDGWVVDGKFCTHLPHRPPSPAGVVEVFANERGEEEARVVDARKDTMSREIFRHPDLAPLATLQRVRDHFICRAGWCGGGGGGGGWVEGKEIPYST